jgi:GLPGLI family protein
MKSFLLLLMLSVSACFLYGQVVEVTYDHTKNYHFLQEMKSNNTYLQSSKGNIFQSLMKADEYVLIHSAGISLFVASATEVDDPINVDGNVTVKTNKDGYREYKYYKDQTNKLMINQVSILYRNFVIEDELPSYNWQISDSTKTIGNYACRKAFAFDPVDSSEVFAWYAEDIPVNDGPRGYWGLPGLILEVNSGIDRIVATKITFNSTSPKLEKPKKGKKLSLTQYQQTVEDLKTKDIFLDTFDRN